MTLADLLGRPADPLLADLVRLDADLTGRHRRHPHRTGARLTPPATRPTP